MFIFPVQLTTSRIGNLTRLVHTLLHVMTIHTYIHGEFIYAFMNRAGTYSIYKKTFFYRFNDRGAHLLTVDISEQPLSVGPYIFLCDANEE